MKVRIPILVLKQSRDTLLCFFKNPVFRKRVFFMPTNYDIEKISHNNPFPYLLSDNYVQEYAALLHKAKSCWMRSCLHIYVSKELYFYIFLFSTIDMMRLS